MPIYLGTQLAGYLRKLDHHQIKEQGKTKEVPPRSCKGHLLEFFTTVPVKREVNNCKLTVS